MKTFNKQGILTKAALDARFPKFIAYIDISASAKATNPDGSYADKGIFERAMVETDLISAMRALETAVKKRINEVYLCGIYQITNEFDADGMPLYEMVIGARVTGDNDGQRWLSDWKLWDKEHGETPHGLSIWISNDFARDDLEEWSRDGALTWVRKNEVS